LTIHYHGTPITPLSVLESLAGKSFCVSYAHPANVKRCHEIGQSVMLDNAAFTIWKQGGKLDPAGFYAWAKPWLDCPTTWGVIPDVIDGSEFDNWDLAMECPFPVQKMAPVWHLHESLDYLNILVNRWPRVCFGSSGQFAEVGTPQWHDRIQQAFDAVWDRRPMIHMLRGMKCARYPYPFASLDSTDVARNHHAAKRGPLQAQLMAGSWDSLQCPITYTPPSRAQEWIA